MQVVENNFRSPIKTGATDNHWQTDAYMYLTGTEFFSEGNFPFYKTVNNHNNIVILTTCHLAMILVVAKLLRSTYRNSSAMFL